MHMDIDTNMQMIGKREPYYATFTVRPRNVGMCLEVSYVACCLFRLAVLIAVLSMALK